jgi:hypothetical protein
MSDTFLCPRCEVRRFTPYGGSGDATKEAPYPALSRIADIYICSPCGTHEAFMDMGHVPLPPPSDWPVVLPEALIEMQDQLVP